MADAAASSQPLSKRATRSFRWMRHAWTFAKTQPLGAVAALLIVALVLSAALAPVLAPYDPNATRVGPVLHAPSWHFLFGTDNHGRDVLSRVLYGGRTSLLVGVTSVLVGTLAGVFLGLVSGYLGGWVDLVLQRGVDALMAFPALVLGLAVVSLLGTSVLNLILTIAIVIAPLATRVVRSVTLSIKQEVYVEAARATGATNARIVLRHIFPNVAAPVLIIVSVQIGLAILVASSLAFLGLGPPPPSTDWGSMLSREARRAMETAPWLGIFPGLFLSLTILGFNLFGDSLRDILDPRMRGSGRRGQS